MTSINKPPDAPEGKRSNRKRIIYCWIPRPTSLVCRCGASLGVVAGEEEGEQETLGKQAKNQKCNEVAARMREVIVEHGCY